MLKKRDQEIKNRQAFELAKADGFEFGYSIHDLDLLDIEEALEHRSKAYSPVKVVVDGFKISLRDGFLMGAKEAIIGATTI